MFTQNHLYFINLRDPLWPATNPAQHFIPTDIIITHSSWPQMMLGNTFKGDNNANKCMFLLSFLCTTSSHHHLVLSLTLSRLLLVLSSSMFKLQSKVLLPTTLLLLATKQVVTNIDSALYIAERGINIHTNHTSFVNTFALLYRVVDWKLYILKKITGHHQFIAQHGAGVAPLPLYRQSTESGEWYISPPPDRPFIPSTLMGRREATGKSAIPAAGGGKSDDDEGSRGNDDQEWRRA